MSGSHIFPAFSEMDSYSIPLTFISVEKYIGYVIIEFMGIYIAIFYLSETSLHICLRI